MGRSAEITRDEVKFFRFVDRLRLKFSDVFLQLLRSQLILKGIIKQDDWDSINQDIGFNFKSESYFHELQETEILKERAEMLRDLDEYIGKYYSIEWIRKNVLRQDEEEMKIIDAQIKKEVTAGDIPDESEEDTPDQSDNTEQEGEG